jgi:hypothetical protein
MRTRRSTSLLAAAILLLGTIVGLDPADAQAPATPPASGAEAQPDRTTWYFYKVRWGHQDEFLNLFQKNHYPVLKAYQELGRYASIRTYTPQYHGDGRADWTFAVELVERQKTGRMPPEAELLRKLFPDQATFRKEERRRFEILDAHWDVPLDSLDLTKREMVDQ